MKDELLKQVCEDMRVNLEAAPGVAFAPSQVAGWHRQLEQVIGQRLADGKGQGVDRYDPALGVYDEASLRAAGRYWEALEYEANAREEWPPGEYDRMHKMQIAVERAMEAHSHGIDADDRYVPKATTKPPTNATYRCKYCGEPSQVDPTDQSPSPDYCHPEDHGTTVDEDGAKLRVQLQLEGPGQAVAWLRPEDVADLLAGKPWTDGAFGQFSQREREDFTTAVYLSRGAEKGQSTRDTRTASSADARPPNAQAAEYQWFDGVSSRTWNRCSKAIFDELLAKGVMVRALYELKDLGALQAETPPLALDYTPGQLDAEAPARIWLQIDTAGDKDERDVPWPGPESVTWQDEQIGGVEIGYVRADLVRGTAPAAAPPVESQQGLAAHG